MEIRVLGPLDLVSLSGAEIMIGSAKQRELLAFLAAHAPYAVSTDRIAVVFIFATRLLSIQFHWVVPRFAIDPNDE